MMMTAREAMEQAIWHARRGERPEARLWLDIARELREGSMLAGPEVTMPVKAVQRDTTVLRRPDESPGSAVGAEGRCGRCGYFVKWDGEHLIHTRTGQIVCPVGQPGPDDTIVHTYATLDDGTTER